ncbi:hypothetical protein Cgig2_010438 [Carnegiea gigantea]|uniref:Uncharacterized protein n=1 Tax=Carnegiea gigantea TaxID=171969 RepID=A0A9Q1JNU7_9CARY|nr:hypothetical protein Cgig2_010438 [Carnegiea gigantea]
MGMISFPLSFGDKAKERTLEVNFLVIDVPTAYNVILGRPTLHKVKAVITPYLLQLLPKTKKKTQLGAYTSNVRVLVIITIPIRLAAFAIRRCISTIKRHGFLVTQVTFISCWQDEVHQLRVSSFGLGLIVILYVLNLSPTRDPERTSCSPLGSANSAPAAASAALASASDLEQPLLDGIASLFLRPLRPPSLFSPFLGGICTWLRTPSTSDTRPGGQGLASPGVDLMTFNARANAWRIILQKINQGKTDRKVEGSIRMVDLTSVRITCSSMTFGGSAEPEKARAQDLIRFSTKAYLAMGSAVKKYMKWARAITKGSLATRGTAHWSSWEPSAEGDPEGAGLIYRYGIGNFLRLAKLIFWGNVHNHTVINKGREAWKMTALHLGAGRPLRDRTHRSTYLQEVEVSKEELRVRLKMHETPLKIQRRGWRCNSDFEGKQRGKQSFSLENLFLPLGDNLRACSNDFPKNPTPFI